MIQTFLKRVTSKKHTTFPLDRPAPIFVIISLGVECTTSLGVWIPSVKAADIHSIPSQNFYFMNNISHSLITKQACIC